MLTLDEKIEIIDYDPRWPQFFESEKNILHKELSDIVLQIEHFGSTAIPGMLAKPTIDLLVGVINLETFNSEHAKKLNALGYEGFGEAGVPGRLYFRKRGVTNFNLAITTHQSSLWQNNIMLREYLKTHPQEAQAYAKLKEKIIRTGTNTLLQYSNLKSDYIAELLKKASNWQNYNP